nr:reverse transcriptase domain-containing protein [Tanacetum cinerariifolium]
MEYSHWAVCKRPDQEEKQVNEESVLFPLVRNTKDAHGMPGWQSMWHSFIKSNGLDHYEEKDLELQSTINRAVIVSLRVLFSWTGDPGKFHIPCDFPGMDECLALADLDASINLIPLSTERSLIDVYTGELTLRVNNEAVTFNLVQTSRYSANYNDMTANQIDVIDMACEEYSQEVIGFSDVIVSGNPTPYYDPIISTSSPTLTPFGDSDFLLEKFDAFLALEDDPTSPEVDHSYYNTEGEILLLEAFLNDDPSLSPPTQGMYLPQVELKDIPLHLEYAFLEGDDKLPVIITKDLSVEEKAALIKVLKSHKQAIAWKLSDIKAINPEFCTHKILMEDDFKPAVQHQRRVNPKIHEVIKKEVLKLLDTGLIYPISDSPWVSLVHCVPKKGGFTVVENEENELIPTRLVTGWRVCIDYRKLNEATRKDHFPLPFMDQMLEGLAGNEYYCFLDGTFQRCMMAIFRDMIKKTMEVFIDDFSKSHFMVKEGTVLGHKISKNEVEVDKAKIDVIAKLPHPTTVKDIRSFLGHAGFYRRFIQDFSKIARPMTRLLEKDTLFFFSIECVEAFQTLKKKLNEAPILVAPDWDLPFELMYDLSKWVEAKALPTNDARVVFKFLKSLFARFGTPRAIISDRGTHFCNDQFTKVMLKNGVTHRLATTYHPQTSGQVEVSNHGLKRILERTVGENRDS